MAKLYSLQVIKSEPNAKESDCVLSFIGIFDENNIRNGIGKFIKDNCSLLPFSENDTEESLLEKYVNDALIDKDFWLHEEGTIYQFVVNCSECNENTEVEILYYNTEVTV